MERARDLHFQSSLVVSLIPCLLEVTKFGSLFSSHFAWANLRLLVDASANFAPPTLAATCALSAGFPLLAPATLARASAFHSSRPQSRLLLVTTATSAHTEPDVPSTELLGRAAAAADRLSEGVTMGLRKWRWRGCGSRGGAANLQASPVGAEQREGRRRKLIFPSLLSFFSFSFCAANCRVPTKARGQRAGRRVKSRLIALFSLCSRLLFVGPPHSTGARSRSGRAAQRRSAQRRPTTGSSRGNFNFTAIQTQASLLIRQNKRCSRF